MDDPKDVFLILWIQHPIWPPENIVVNQFISVKYPVWQLLDCLKYGEKNVSPEPLGCFYQYNIRITLKLS